MLQAIQFIPFTLAGGSMATGSFFLLGIDHSVCCEGGWLKTRFLGVGRAAGLKTLIVGVDFSWSSFRFWGGVELGLLVPLDSSLLLMSSLCFKIFSNTSDGTGWVGCRDWRVRRARDRRLVGCINVHMFAKCNNVMTSKGSYNLHFSNI